MRDEGERERESVCVCLSVNVREGGGLCLDESACLSVNVCGCECLRECVRMYTLCLPACSFCIWLMLTSVHLALLLVHEQKRETPKPKGRQRRRQTRRKTGQSSCSWQRT